MKLKEIADTLGLDLAELKKSEIMLFDSFLKNNDPNYIVAIILKLLIESNRVIAENELYKMQNEEFKRVLVETLNSRQNDYLEHKTKINKIAVKQGNVIEEQFMIIDSLQNQIDDINTFSVPSKSKSGPIKH